MYIAGTLKEIVSKSQRLIFQGEKITALTTAAKVEVEPIWASLLAKALDGKDVKELLTNVGGGGAPAAGVAAASGGAAAAATEEAPKEEKKEEAKEESDDDMVGVKHMTRRINADATGLRLVRLIDSPEFFVRITLVACLACYSQCMTCDLLLASSNETYL